MHLVRCLLLVAGFLATSAASAQSALCNTPGTPGFVASSAPEGIVGFLNLIPPGAGGGVPLSLEVGAVSYVPVSVSSSVHAHAIDVAFSAGYFGIGIPPPVTCLTTSLDVLAPGTYVINLTLTDPNTPAPPVLISTPVTIGGGTDIAAAPALSPTVLALLGLLLGAVAVKRFRRAR